MAVISVARAPGVRNGCHQSKAVLLQKKAIDVPLERIPLAGDVLGMGTTTSYLFNHLFNLLGLQGHQLVLPHVLVLEKSGSSGKRLFDRHGVVDRVHETFAA